MACFLFRYPQCALVYPVYVNVKNKNKLKVARAVNIKLVFKKWFFFYNFVIVIEYRKTPYKNLDKALLFSRNQVFCLKDWKLWRAPTTIDFINFCWNFAHVSLRLLTNSYKRVFGISLFRLDLELLAKIKRPCFYKLTETRFINNSRSKQTKKIPNTLLPTACSYRVTYGQFG